MDPTELILKLSLFFVGVITWLAFFACLKLTVGGPQNRSRNSHKHETSTPNAMDSDNTLTPEAAREFEIAIEQAVAAAISGRCGSSAAQESVRAEKQREVQP